MSKIRSLDDLERELKSYVLDKVWFGTRGSDISGVTELLGIKGVISCYGGSELNIPVLSGDSESLRKKSSGDDLAKELADNSKYLDFTKKHHFSAVLPYDAPIELEEFCKNNNLKCFSAPSWLKDKLRDKTEIENISKAISLPIIPGVSGNINDFDYNTLVKNLGLPLFLQFEGSAGSGNFIIKTVDEFNKIKKLMAGNRLNVKKYFVGRSCSVDICVTPKAILCGTLEEMLIGAEPLNSNPTEYVGGSWFDSGFSDELRKKISRICVSLGEYMRGNGFKGYFHPDFLINGNDVYLTEVNMRFGGSCGIFAKAELAEKRVVLMGTHLLSFCNPNQEYSENINQINLHPMDYAFMVIKNNKKESVTISKHIKSGIYKITNDSIKLFETSSSFGDLNKTDEVFIIGLPSSDDDTVIENGAFICQAVVKFPIVNKENKLSGVGKDLADKVYRFLLD